MKTPDDVMGSPRPTGVSVRGYMPDTCRRKETMTMPALVQEKAAWVSASRSDSTTRVDAAQRN
ncbi:MAG: hypothetical protein KIT35_25780 [Piscinibacter sp.]|uniref:hypothetical protein n=1 Tax=Piscinibacter sp. TaxID=1903157 RepID=UPI002582721B|nr:hypothetical protein [Piscinibacter sp.]MCL4736664.1 hypothetical protein [Burkholderiaceae bacterium]MCW5667262.1 hypothetical protein [Piscinibacter sp.]